MKFFTHFYLENHMYFNDYLKYVLIFAALVVLLLAVSQYLRHRMDTKYRDLSIIALLLLILISGIQYLSYSERQNFAADTSRMVGFLNALIENQKVEKRDISVNSTHLYNGMIVGIKNQYYEVHFNQDFSAYTLTPINFGQQQHRTHRQRITGHTHGSILPPCLQTPYGYFRFGFANQPLR